MSNPSDSSFAERLAYARWLRVVDETDADLAGRAGVTAPWLAKWKLRVDSPPGRKEGPALARALGVREEWLLDNEGAAPRAGEWPAWLAKWRAAPAKADKKKPLLVDPMHPRAKLLGDERAPSVQHATRVAAGKKSKGARDVPPARRTGRG